MIGEARKVVEKWVENNCDSLYNDKFLAKHDYLGQNHHAAV